MSKSLISYILGYVLSVTLTLAAFFVVLRPGFFNLGSSGVISAILSLAVIQLVVQLIFFLHIGDESEGRWNLATFLTTVSVVLIIVVGSLWIMAHLNYNMSSEQMNSYLIKQEGMQM